MKELSVDDAERTLELVNRYRAVFVPGAEPKTALAGIAFTAADIQAMIFWDTWLRQQRDADKHAEFAQSFAAREAAASGAHIVPIK